ncbi:MAG: orotate phosphoribosyltransferase [Pyrinomonadaceae bacterium]
MNILEHFKQTNALLEGHFVLSSGRHSSQYLQCALALQNPSDAAKFGRAIAEKFVRTICDNGRISAEIETVASPAIGGLIVGYAVARALNVRFIWTERENGVMTLRRGFTVKEGERILVVEDVITTGGSTRECIAALEKSGAKIVGAASIIDRSNGTADVGVPRIELVRLDVQSYKSENCPMCARGETPIKPGSRTSPK